MPPAPVTANGPVFMNVPRLRPDGRGGQIAGCAHSVLSIKPATNAKMYARIAGAMGIHCGDIVDGGVAVENL